MNEKLTNLEVHKEAQEAPRELPVWMLDRKTVDELKFCQCFAATHPLKCIGGRFYGLDGLVDEDALGHEIYDMLQVYLRCGLSKRVKAILEALRLYCHSEPLPLCEDEIHLQNGVLKTDGTWIPEKRFCVGRLNVTYDPEIWKRVHYPEKFLTFLLEMLSPEDVTTLQEYLGYCLIPSTKGQAMLFLIGQGGEGKSRIGVVLQEIFGQNMLTGSFQRIETDRFFRYNLKDRLLMVDDDMQMQALPSTGYIKTLVTAETPIDIEAKGKQSEQALLYTRFLCFGNGSPKALYDKSKGFSRRLIILTTLPTPKSRVNDPNLAAQFLAEKEQIFCWMFDGLRRLLANQFRFTLSPKTKENIREAVADGCNIPEFMADSSRVIYGETFCVSSSELYQSYSHWCEDNALTPLKRDSFVSWLKENAEEMHVKFSYHVHRGNKRVRGFIGVAVRS